jgi:helicase SWR1
MLDNVIIQEGDFTTEYFEKMDWWKDLPEVAGSQQVSRNAEATTPQVDIEQALLEAEDDETDARAAIAARKEMRMDETEFADTPAHDKSALISSRSATTSPGPKEPGIVVPSDTLETESQMDVGGIEAMDDDLTDRGMQLEVGHVDQYMLRFWEREMFGQYLGFGGLPGPETPGIT